MNLPFFKLSVGTNDLLLINLMGEVLPDDRLLPGLSVRMCRRHRGIGANGVIFLLDHPEAGARVRYFTRKGREISLFFDPLLAAARYLFDSGFSGTRALTVEIPQGIRTIEAIDSNNFRISLGTPMDSNGEVLAEEISTTSGTFLSLENQIYPISPILLHSLWGTVFFESDPYKGKRELAGLMKNSRLGNEKFIPLFAQVYSDDDIAIYPWQKKNAPREVSLAAGAAAAAAAMRGFTNRSLMTRLGQYDFFIEWKPGSEELLCTGGAEYIFTGDYYYDEAAFYGA